MYKWPSILLAILAGAGAVINVTSSIHDMHLALTLGEPNFVLTMLQSLFQYLFCGILFLTAGILFIGDSIIYELKKLNATKVANEN